MGKAFAIIPIYNRWQYTRECVDSLRKQKGVELEIILVDSGSTDGTAEQVSKLYGQEVTYIQGDSSWWWTKATSVGVEYALGLAQPGDYVLLMNNDCFVKTNYLVGLQRVARNHRGAIIGSVCVDSSHRNSVVEAGIKIDWTKGTVYSLTQKYGTDYRRYQRKPLVDSDALPGKGTLIPVEVFRSLGNFSVQLPHYLADYEFTYRAKQAGHPLLVETKIPIYHHWRATGLGMNWERNNYSYREAWQLISSRKSMNNILDWVIFIRLACPRPLQMRNFTLLGLRLLASLSKLKPFCYVAPQNFVVRLVTGLGLTTFSNKQKLI